VNRKAVFASGRRKTQIRGHGDDRARANADTVHGGDDRLAAADHRLDQIAGHAGEGSSPFMSIATSGPMMSCTSPPEQKLPPLEAKTTTSTSLA
jgi:hypothetical protein